MDEKTIEALARQLGITPSGSTSFTAQRVRDYEQKSDDQLVTELLTLQRKLTAAGISQEQQLALVESLMPMMNGQQKTRLNKIIGLLKQSSY